MLQLYTYILKCIVKIPTIHRVYIIQSINSKIEHYKFLKN